MPWDFCYSGCVCGYGYIHKQLANAVNDPAIKKVILLIDSPGGVASGCFDLSDVIYKIRKVKPVVAICDDSAYSAAYVIAIRRIFHRYGQSITKNITIPLLVKLFDRIMLIGSSKRLRLKREYF